MSWTQVVLSHMYPWPVGVLVTASALSFVFGAFGLWCLWRVKRMLAHMPVVRERLDSLSNSVTLLTDTTESCFKALAMQLQFMQAQGGIPALPVVSKRTRPAASESVDDGLKKARQRRVVGAARRGETMSEIAAREDVAEAEVALRVHMNNQQVASAEAKRHGTLLS